MIKRNHNYLIILLLIIVLSRIITSINYIEDIDSLRFALSIQDYNILMLQPHFPGYPVFCFLAKIFYNLFGNMGIAFSLIGGLSIFFIVYYLLRTFNTGIRSYEGQYIVLVIFFNPLLWIMSNRYMPDLMGLSISLSSLYYLIFSHRQGNELEKGFFLSGILAGVRLSYMPLLLYPLFRILFEHKNRVRLTLFLCSGVLIWLVPMIFITGYNDLFEIGRRHTVGHFMDYGGTVFTEQSFANRFIYLFRSVWADGFGGYWFSRGWSAVILTVLLLFQFGSIIKDLKKKWDSDNNLRSLLYCILIYTIWVLLFQNVIYKSRHILPILLFFCILLVHGQERFRGKIYSAVIYSYFIILASHDLTIIKQHKNHTAIHKLKNYISDRDKVKTIISIPLINYYLKRHKIDVDFISVEDSLQIESFKNQDYDSRSTIMIGDYQHLLGNKYISTNDTTFYHNPYMNQMWPKIQVYNINMNI